MSSTSFLDTLAARGLHALAWLAGLPGLHRRRTIASWLAARELRTDSARARIVAVNLKLAGLDSGLQREVLVQTMLTLLESLRFWTRPRAVNLAEVVEVEGIEHLDAAEARGRLHAQQRRRPGAGPGLALGGALVHEDLELLDAGAGAAQRVEVAFQGRTQRLTGDYHTPGPASVRTAGWP